MLTIGLLAFACSTSSQQNSGNAGPGANGTATAGNNSAATGTSIDEQQQPSVPAPGPAAPLPTGQAPGCSSNSATTTLANDITSSQNLTGTIVVSKPINITAGATVTADQCAKFMLAAGASISVAGTFNVTGAGNGSVVAFLSQDNTSAWGPIAATSGGTITMDNVYINTNSSLGVDCQAGAASCAISHATLTRNATAVHVAAPMTLTSVEIDGVVDPGIHVEQGGNLALTDGVLTGNGLDHDFIVVDGGTVIAKNISITGAHCAFHINQSDRVELHDSALTGNVYGFMVGNTPNFVVNNSNLENNSAAHLLCLGGSVPNPDLSGNYWQGGITTGQDVSCMSGINSSNTQSAAIGSAGPTSVSAAAGGSSLLDESDGDGNPVIPPRCVKPI